MGNSILTTVPSPPVGTTVDFYYAGLPTQNKDFGEKKYIKASLQAYDVAESVRVYVYFPVDNDISNHPGGTSPNWFYYWQEGNAVPNMSGVIYDSGIGYGETSPTGTIKIGPAADNIHYPCDTPAPGCYGFLINGIGFGGDAINGMDCTAEVVAHERYHAWVYANWRIGGQWYNDYGGPRTTGPGGNDIDGDWLPNEYENDVSHTLPTNSDTHDVARIRNNPSYRAYGDEEYMAMLAGNGVTGDHQKDWSAGTYSKQWP